MKILLLIALFAVPLTLSAQSIEDRIKTFDKPKDYAVSFDKFEKETKVDWHGFIKGPPNKGFISGNQSLEVNAAVHIPQNGDAWYSLFFNPSEHTLYSKDALKFLLDDQLFTIKDTTDIEYYASFIVTVEEWNKIIAARKVDMRLRLFETTLDIKTLTAFRNLASLLK